MRQTDGITSCGEIERVKGPEISQKRFVNTLYFDYIRVPFLGRQRVFYKNRESPL